MTDYRVQLEIYDGPMDLLLYLIRRDEIDIYNLPVASITEQYMAYINMMEELDVDLAGEFLVMAATLIELKSLMVIPRDIIETEDGEVEDPTDPRLELIHQLLEYKRFKDAAGMLEDAAEERSQKFHRPLSDLERIKKELKAEQELDMESVQIWDLMDAFSRLMAATLANKAEHNVIRDDTPIDVYEIEILSRSQKESPLKFDAVFRDVNYREGMVGRFLAVLELMRHRLIRIEQEKTFGTIYIYPQTDMDAEQAVMNTISGAQIAEEEEELLKEVGIEKSEPEKLFADTVSITEDLAGFSEDVELESDDEVVDGHFADINTQPEDFIADEMTEDNPIEEIDINELDPEILDTKLAEFSEDEQIDLDSEDGQSLESDEQKQ